MVLSDNQSTTGGFMERINVRVESKLKQQLEIEAQEKGVSPSEIVRQALQEHLQRQTPRESCYDLAKRLGIIGSAKGLPTDLSTNPEHMEGFGLD
jgi:predicted transcriptional regulator